MSGSAQHTTLTHTLTHVHILEYTHTRSRVVTLCANRRAGATFERRTPSGSQYFPNRRANKTRACARDRIAHAYTRHHNIRRRTNSQTHTHTLDKYAETEFKPSHTAFCTTTIVGRASKASQHSETTCDTPVCDSPEHCLTCPPAKVCVELNRGIC